MFVAQPIEWTDRGVVMLDQRLAFVSVIPSGATRFFLSRRGLARRVAESRNLSSITNSCETSRCYLSCS